VIVLVSAVLHTLAAWRLTGLWIFPDEGIYAQRALEFWHHGRLSGIGYSVLYPILVGAPLSVGTLHTGYELAKPVQSVVVSLAAVPVYVYLRAIVRERWALVAAALTVASPLLLYSGLLMTEVLFYPLAAWTMLAMANAVATGERRRIGLTLVLIAACVLTRTQAIAFFPVFALAVCADAGFARSLRRLRAFWPIAALAVVALALVVARPGILGSYSVTVRGGYPFGSAVRLSVELLALLVVSTAVLPAAAFVLFAVDGVRGRLADPGLRALVATTVAGSIVLPLQVGFFAARFAPHLLERDLAALPPLFFALFAAWIGRGAPRPFVRTAATVLGLGALVLLTPWNTLVVRKAFQDMFSPLLYYRLSHGNPAAVLAIVVGSMLLLFAFAPRRARSLLVVAPLALLVTASAVASNTLAGVVESVQHDMVGPVPSWIDRDASGDVAYFYDGESFWTVVWQERFWNPRITQIVATTPVPGPIAQTPVGVGPSGRLPITTPYAVATDYHHFVGTAVAQLPQIGLDEPGLTLWKLDPPARLSFETFGFQPNGDIVFPVTVKVFDCGGGALQLTLLTKETDRLRIRLDGKTVVDQAVQPNAVWQGSVPGPRSRMPQICIYTIVPQNLLGSTSIAFVRP
jgi:hypothetical protein